MFLYFFEIAFFVLVVSVDILFAVFLDVVNVIVGDVVFVVVFVFLLWFLCFFVF